MAHARIMYTMHLLLRYLRAICTDCVWVRKVLCPTCASWVALFVPVVPSSLPPLGCDLGHGGLKCGKLIRIHRLEEPTSVPCFCASN